MSNCWGVVPAAGQGLRLGGETVKQYIKVEGGYVLDHSIQALLECREINKIVVAIRESDRLWETTQAAGNERVTTCNGGDNRFASVANALNILSDKADDMDWVVVHDGVRPCLHGEDIRLLLRTIEHEPAGGIAVMPVDDTIKRVDGEYIEGTLDRNALMRAATPQIFRYSVLCEAFEKAREQGFEPSDEASAVELIKKPIRTVVCSQRNIKLTNASDMVCIEAFLRSNLAGERLKGAANDG